MDLGRGGKLKSQIVGVLEVVEGVISDAVCRNGLPLGGEKTGWAPFGNNGTEVDGYTYRNGCPAGRATHLQSEIVDQHHGCQVPPALKIQLDTSATPHITNCVVQPHQMGDRRPKTPSLLRNIARDRAGHATGAHG